MDKSVPDHLGRQITVPELPRRIVSICPAITESLLTMGLVKDVVGRTKFCIFPKGTVDNIPVVGGTKEVKEEIIRDLQPDLILAEKEENTKEIVQALEKIAPVFVMEIQKIEESYRLLETLGILTDRVQTANDLITSCKSAFDNLSLHKNLTAAYVIWRKPYMVVGGTTYINDVLQTMGFQNPFEKESSRYPVVTKEGLADAKLDVLFLASEPFPFQEKHIAEFQSFLPNTKIHLVDGEMFWYGTKMLIAGDYLRELIKRVESSLVHE